MCLANFNLKQFCSYQYMFDNASVLASNWYYKEAATKVCMLAIQSLRSRLWGTTDAESSSGQMNKQNFALNTTTFRISINTTTKKVLPKD